MKANDDVLNINNKTTTGRRFNEARQKRTTTMMGTSTDAETSATTAAPPPPPSAPPTASLPQMAHTVAVRYQHFLDKSVPQILNRWIATAAIALVYFLRVYYLQGFYIITYALGIYMLNLLIGFLSPQVDPEILELTDGPSLPTRGSDEFRPFVRRLPEFKCWLSITRAFLIAFVMTFFSVFDVPVFWPILLFYWIMLFMLTMRRQITLMIKYKYVPFTFGKRRYDRKRASAADVPDLPRD